MATHAGEVAGHHDAPPKGLVRWLVTTNHKDLGTLYLGFSLLMLLIGGGMALLVRAELWEPGMQLMNPEFFNQMATMHGLILIFGVIMPALTGFANWLLPVMIGAPDMALPRVNNWGFWLLPCAFFIVVMTVFMPGGGPAGGWAMYAPLNMQLGMAFPFLVFSIHLMGISSILGSINVAATVLNMRAPGMTLMRMPLFAWAWLIASFLAIVIMPVLAGGVTMQLTDKFFGTSFFDARGGGDPILYAHIFWFFGHPEVYLMVLPAFGLISHIVPAFSRKPLFGRASMVYAMAAIAFLSFIVWAHHMFTTGMPLAGELFFMFATMLISVPTGVKVFNWVATMWRGSLSFETPMLFAIAFIIQFTIGGLTGLMLSMAPADIQYHHSYFVVAHFHYVLGPGVLFAILAATYFWLPKWTGRMYNERLGKLHFWLSTIFINLLFFPMHFAGLAGMPRRTADYAVQFVGMNKLATIGAMGFGFSQIILIYILWRAFSGHGEKAPAKPWEGAEGLEWELPSPAPYHSWEVPPKVSPEAP